MCSSDLPQIQFEEDRAWLKYKLRGGAKVDGTMEGTGFSFEASTDHSLAFSSYRVHDPGETVQTAVKDDLSSLRLISSAEDIEALAPQEAVAMQAEGTLGASLSARWAFLKSPKDLVDGTQSGTRSNGTTLRASSRLSGAVQVGVLTSSR